MLLQLLYEYVYLLVFALFGLNFAVAELLYVFGIGESRVIGPFVGAGVGILALKITHMQFLVPIIVISCIVTGVMCIVVLPRVTEALVDKVDDFFESKKNDQDQK